MIKIVIKCSKLFKSACIFAFFWLLKHIFCLCGTKYSLHGPVEAFLRCVIYRFVFSGQFFIVENLHFEIWYHVIDGKQSDCRITWARCKTERPAWIKSYCIYIWIVIFNNGHLLSRSDVPHSNGWIPWSSQKTPRHFRYKSHATNIARVAVWAGTFTQNLKSLLTFSCDIPNSDCVVVWTRDHYSRK